MTKYYQNWHIMILLRLLPNPVYLELRYIKLFYQLRVDEMAEKKMTNLP